MEFNVDARRLQLENLKQFISSSKSNVQKVLANLGWNEKEVLRDNQLITCSLDTNHKVPPKHVDRHMQKCALRKERYDLNEEFLSEPQKGPHTIHIDDHKKIEVLSAAHKLIKNFRSGWNGQDPDPKTSDRLNATFSSDERLALYDYAVANTHGPPILPEFDIVNPKRNIERPLTYEEKLALERDMKRKRIKYKSVHTSHKSHREVLREVIDSQMKLYKDWLVENENDSTNLKEREHKNDNSKLEQTDSRAVSRNSTHSSSSQRKYDERNHEEALNRSRSTSRRTSYDRESDKSSRDTKIRKRRSRSHDSHHRRDNYHKRYSEREVHHHNNKDYRQLDKYRRDSDKDRRRSRSRDRRRNGYTDHRY